MTTVEAGEVFGPLVSIVIPTLKRPRFAAEAIESAFGQQGVRFEVVVSINDYAASDECIVERWKNDRRLRVLRHKGCVLPMAENWNRGVNAAEGQFFLLLSDDDLLAPSAVSSLLTAIATTEAFQGGSCAFAWCPVQMIDDEGRQLWTTHSHSGPEPPGSFIQNFFKGRRGAMMSSILHRRRELVARGGFDGKQYGALCDIGFWARAATAYDLIVAVEEPLVKYRLTKSSTTCRQSCDEWVVKFSALLEHIADDFVQGGRAVEARQVLSAKKVCIANSVVTILMQRLGNPGWVREWCWTLWRYRWYFASRDVIMRLVRDGQKVVRLFINRSKTALSGPYSPR